MNMFFGKKYILAVLVFAAIVFFAVATMFYNYDEVKDDVEDEYIRGKGESIVEKMENIKANNELIESGIVRNIFGEYTLLEIYGSIQKLTWKQESHGFEFIKDRRGYAYSGAFYVDKDKDLFEYAKRMRRLAEATAEKGTKTLFICYPEKSWIAKDYGRGLPIRKYDDIQDEFLADLMKNRVDALDLRVSLDKMGADMNRMYYKTDRMMTTYGSFRVFQAIVSEFERRYKESLDPDGSYTDIYNYSVEGYPDVFIGETANSTGKIFFGTDDFEIYNSGFEEDYVWAHIDEEQRSFVRSGNENILLERNYIRVNDIYHKKPLKAFLGGFNHWDRISNIRKPDAPKILCLRDENFSPVAVFLAPLCSELHLINPAIGDIDIEEYVAQNDFDYVLVELSAGHIRDDYFNFFEIKS